ncbi:hypothetical protein ACXYTP_19205 [Tsukamurella ocularis]|uniref:hypothetical protein n=1 Tax=Tsukamurella ocularis TaxID=1970234 RepID=UPI0039F14CB4
MTGDAAQPRTAGLGIGVGAPGLGAPPPSPGATAWLRVVTRWPAVSDGEHEYVTVNTVRWAGHTAADIRSARLRGMRDAGADLTAAKDQVIRRSTDGSGRVEVLTFHDVHPGAAVIS